MHCCAVCMEPSVLGRVTFKGGRSRLQGRVCAQADRQQGNNVANMQNDANADDASTPWQVPGSLVSLG